MNEQQGVSQGPATDKENDPVFDPSANVLQLVEAAIKRQDDLREAEKEHVQEVLRLRGERHAHDVAHMAEIVGLQKDAREEAVNHLRITAELRAQHENQLREAEAKRIDAIRAVDVGAVAAAAAVQTTQASTLAAQVATSAEALRNQVAAAASAQTVALAAALEPIIKDIADLRRAQYEAQGQKTQIVETRSAAEDLRPVMEALTELRRSQSEGVGAKSQVVESRAGGAAIMGYVVGAVGVVATVITVVLVLANNSP